MAKKYEIRSDKRIVAVRSFGSVYKGDVGGFVDDYRNLSHSGNCWIFNDARVSGFATVSGNAYVLDDAHIHGSAAIVDDARVTGSAEVYGHAFIEGCARVGGSAKVYDYAEVVNDARVYGSARVYCNARIIHYANVRGNAHVHGVARIFDHMAVGDYADIICSDHVLFITQFTTWNITVYRTKDGFRVQAGCQNFTLEEMENRVVRFNLEMTNARRLLWDAIIAQTKTWHNK